MRLGKRSERRLMGVTTWASVSGAGFGRWARRFLFSLAPKLPCIGVTLKWGERASYAALISRTNVRRGVRRDNWTEGRLGCRWLENLLLPEEGSAEVGHSMLCHYKRARAG